MAKLFDLTAITEIAEDETTSQHLLSPSTRQVLLACFGLLSNPDNWRDLDEALSDVDLDEIDAVVSQAMDEIIEVQMANTLKFSSITPQIVWGSTTGGSLDLLGAGLIGNRTFAAHYGFVVGDVLRGRYKLGLGNNTGVRNAFVNPTFAGQSFAGGAMNVNAEVGITNLEIETLVTITGKHAESGTGRMIFDTHMWLRMLVYRTNADIQRHIVPVPIVAEFYEDTAQGVGLGASWAISGASHVSSMALISGTLEVLRVN